MHAMPALILRILERITSLEIGLTLRVDSHATTAQRNVSPNRIIVNQFYSSKHDVSSNHGCLTTEGIRLFRLNAGMG